MRWSAAASNPVASTSGGRLPAAMASSIRKLPPTTSSAGRPPGGTAACSSTARCFTSTTRTFSPRAFDGSSLRVTNAGDMESYGAELELLFIPMVDMTLGSAIGYNKAEYESFDNGQCTVEQTFYEYYVVQGHRVAPPVLRTPAPRTSPVSPWTTPRSGPSAPTCNTTWNCRRRPDRGIARWNTALSTAISWTRTWTPPEQRLGQPDQPQA